MALTIYPQGVKALELTAGQSIALSNFGGGIAKIYYLIETTNYPDAWQFQQTLENSSTILGPFADGKKIKIESGNSKVIYDIGTSPDTGIGDADTLGGELPAYYTNASNIDAGTIADARLPATITSDITGNAATATNAGQLGGQLPAYYAVDAATVKVNIDNAIAGYVVADGVGHYDATHGTTLLGPKGASYVDTTGTVNGAIKITLPGTWTTTFIHMRIKIFEFGTNLPFEISCGGYNRADLTTWQSTFAYTLSSRENIRDTAIRFAHDGANCAIFIGELTGSWSYPQIFVTDLSIGYANFLPSAWHDGWSIGFEVSSFGTVAATISNSDLGKYLSEYYISQSAVNAQTTDNTLTAANIATKIITVNNGAAGTTTLTLPLAGDMDTGFPHASNDFGFEFSVINISTVASEDCTIATNTGWTLVGSMVIESFDADRARSSGRFFARKTGTGAWTLYRIA